MRRNACTEKWEVFRQAVHVHNLLNAKAEIVFDQKGAGTSAKKESERQRQVRNRMRILSQQEEQRRVKLENERMMKRLTAIEQKTERILRTNRLKKKKRISEAVKRIGKAKDRFDVEIELDKIEQASMVSNVFLTHKNRTAARIAKQKREKRRLEEENLRMMKRIMATRATISSSALEKEAQKRKKLVQKLSSYQQNRVLDMTHLTIDAVMKNKAPKEFGSPWPPATSSNRSRSQMRPQQRKVRIVQEDDKQDTCEDGQWDEIQQIVDEIISDGGDFEEEQTQQQSAILNDEIQSNSVEESEPKVEESTPKDDIAAADMEEKKQVPELEAIIATDAEEKKDVLELEETNPQDDGAAADVDEKNDEQKLIQQEQERSLMKIEDEAESKRIRKEKRRKRRKEEKRKKREQLNR